MTSRAILDHSSGLSSTAMNIRKYIRETELSDDTPVESPHSGIASFIDNDIQTQNSDLKSNMQQQLAASRTKLNPISEESLNKSEVQNIESFPPNENLYQKKLKYLPNSEFQMNDSNLFTYGNFPNTNSIPNTFKYKSHPNAKTKPSLGNKNMDYAISQETRQNEENNNDNSQPIKTSTLSKQTHYDTTPEWMPPELSDKWVQPSLTDFDKENDPEVNDFGSSVRITKNPNTGKQNDFDFNFSSSNTMIHKAPPEQSEVPMWKKASEDYRFHRNSQQQLQQIFMFNENSTSQHDDRELGPHDEKRENSNNHSITSTFSTPMATMSNQQNYSHVNKPHLRHLDDVLGEEGKKKTGVSNHVQNPDSPLKLFGDKYNTFTKEKLNDILAKMNTRASDLEFAHKQDTNNEIESSHVSTNKINNGIIADSYTEEQFFRKADTIFNNIQKRGFKLQNNNIASNSYTTATSTPKNDKHASLQEISLQDEYSSFISGFEQQSNDNRDEESHSQSSHKYTVESSHMDYSSADYYGRQGVPQELGDNNSLLNKYRSDDETSYTFDEQSEEEDISEMPGDPKYPVISNKMDKENPQLEDNNIHNMNSRLDELEKMMKIFYQKDLEELKQENFKLRKELENRDFDKDATIDYADLTENNISQVSELIKWKRASQLNLQNSKANSTNVMKEGDHALRGRVKPDVELPVEYDNMVLDTENFKWIANNKDNEPRGSLDDIDDLITNGFVEDSTRSINQSEEYVENNGSVLKQAKKRSGTKLEVSFHLPHTSSDIEREPSNITQVSQLDDMTFSQIRKRLVSIITELLSKDTDFSKLSWNEVESISLKDCSLENIKDLDSFLPNLRKLDISDNQVTFLDGLPKNVMNLNISKNKIENITSFKNYNAIQILDVSTNKLKNLNHFVNTLHLTRLNVSNNMISSLDGIKGLINLSYLNLSQNELSGVLDFSIFNFECLQELNLSENRITSVVGLDNLKELRVLNLNENRLTSISSNEASNLKKLLLKMNELTVLDVLKFPYLRVLRIDGNNLHTIKNLKRLKFLDELSCKSQSHSAVLNCILEECCNVKKLDLSGNLESTFMKFLAKVSNDKKYFPFLNLSVLILSAMNLKSLPDSFALLFPNVCELNLNFNRISSIQGLSSLKNLRKLHLVSNELKRTDTILRGLSSSRSTLRVLDLRLNKCNADLYPYVFSPQELDYVENATPIQLETLDDIENFAIHYQTLNKTMDEWQERDSNFLDQLSQESKTHKLRQRLNYETLLINFFIHLRKLDGGVVDKTKRNAFRKRVQEINI